MPRDEGFKEVRRGLRILRKRADAGQREFADRMLAICELMREFRPVDLGTIENGAWEIISRELVPALADIEAGSRIKNIKGIDDRIWVESLKNRLQNLMLKGDVLTGQLGENSREYHIVRREIAEIKRATAILDEMSGEAILERLEGYLKDGCIPVNDPEKEFKEVLEVNPMDYTALINLLSFFEQRERDEELIEIGTQIASYYPEDLVARAKLIDALIRVSDYDKALELAKDGIKLSMDHDPSDRRAWNRYVSREDFDNFIWRVNRLRELESSHGEDLDPEVYELLKTTLRGSPAIEDVPEALSTIEDDLAKRAMIYGMRHVDPRIVGLFAGKIVECGEKMVPYLKDEIITDGSLNKRNRVIAFDCLSKMKGVEAAYNLLLELLESDDEDLASTAGLGLGFFGDKRAKERLLEKREQMSGEYRLRLDLAVSLLEEGSGT
ncbi:MAG: hypothetical protein CW694_00640 [Candidatus Syntrophoarchaeum sp. WYZ-LMO15]|nr:MAG: hypothetical protein CW694_00640 [Candidatus Syntrophoarchaeum sp. WYZ-LMO15]